MSEHCTARGRPAEFTWAPHEDGHRVVFRLTDGGRFSVADPVAVEAMHGMGKPAAWWVWQQFARCLRALRSAPYRPELEAGR